MSTPYLEPTANHHDTGLNFMLNYEIARIWMISHQKLLQVNEFLNNSWIYLFPYAVQRIYTFKYLLMFLEAVNLNPAL